MATIVNNPGSTSDSSGSNGLLMGIFLILALILLFWFFGMPYLRGRGGNGGGTPTTTVENNVQAPEAPQQAPQTQEQAPAQDGDTNINVPIPEKIDVNVQNRTEGQ